MKRLINHCFFASFILASPALEKRIKNTIYLSNNYFYGARFEWISLRMKRVKSARTRPVQLLKKLIIKVLCWYTINPARVCVASKTFAYTERSTLKAMRTKLVRLLKQWFYYLSALIFDQLDWSMLRKQNFLSPLTPALLVSSSQL